MMGEPRKTKTMLVITLAAILTTIALLELGYSMLDFKDTVEVIRIIKIIYSN